MRSLLFTAVRFCISRLFGTRLARLFWHIPGANYVYRRLISLRPDEVEVDGHVLRLDPLDSLLLSVHGTYEAQERERFRTAIRPGDTVIDVGAHIGLYTLDAARAVGESGRVIAFEPSTKNREILLHNLSKNGYRNVEVYGTAVSDHDGEGVLSLSPINTGDNVLSEEPIEPVNAEKVKVVRLDSLPISQVNVIKMDIQGAEPAALRGAAALLARSPRVILFTEVSPTHLGQRGCADYLAQLRHAGFRIDQQISLDGEHLDLVCVKDGSVSSAPVSSPLGPGQSTS